MLRIMTWFWRQTPNRHDYDADKVNRWAAQLRAGLAMPHELACVTDHPEGIDPSIRIIPLPTQFLNVSVRSWSERAGLPQCYRRLALFAPNAAEIFGAEHLVSMDLDSVFFPRYRGDLDALFAEPVDFRMFAGTSSTRPYNGSMLQIRAGARPQVFDAFARDPIGVATRARERFIGSDQAVISMILGKGERTWTETDGVYAYSPRFMRLHAREGQPARMRALFFPGHVKPWHETGIPWIKAAWQGHNPQPRRQKLRLRAYADPKGWGKAFARAAEERGHFCSMFTRPRMVPTGHAFVRLDQQGAQRDLSKRIVAELARQGIVTLPTPREAVWYDDKGAQISALEPWLPPTILIRSQGEAREFAEIAAYPLVSKSVDGSASKGVRLLADRAAALAEVERAWTPPGIPTVDGRRQLGYVYWQSFIPGNACDYRVVVVGRYAYGLVRSVRPGDFRASGSGVFEPITLRTERERAAMRLGVEVADALRTDWMAFDVVFDEGGRPFVLELSSAWTMKAYEACPCFDRATLEPTDRTGADSFTMAVEIMEGMAAA